MKKRMMNLLLELLKDSKRSDRELAKVLGVSQPTVSRMRSRLVKKGIIRGFTVIPDYVKMGYEIMAISCVKRKKGITEPGKGTRWANIHPNIIFAARAHGMGKNGVVISLHKNYTAYSNFIDKNRGYWADEMEEYDTMLISLKEDVAKPLSPEYLAEQEET